MKNALLNLREPQNEPILGYTSGSREHKELVAKLAELKSSQVEIPLIIGGEEVKTNNLEKCIIPHDHQTVLGLFHKAGEKEAKAAIEAALAAKEEWTRLPWQDRASVFMKAADLLAGPYRALINGATMLGQSKNIYQSEIDAACELIDFLRFNVFFMNQIYQEQPYSPPGFWNRMDYRPLEGFVFAVTPFNFTSIAGNLATAPAMMGNTVIWKPASSAVYSGYFIMKILQEAGLPAGVINFLPGTGRVVAAPVLADVNLAGVHFTGSTGTFQHIWRTVGTNIERYRTYPRLVGETGGKDFVVAHSSADPDALVTALVQGAFEYQGQKCSAASRAYIPDNLWPTVKEMLCAQMAELKLGDVGEFDNYINAVIDKQAFDDITGYIEYIKEAPDAEIISGGTYDESRGYFIAPTVAVTEDPFFKTMEEEIFGPVLTVYVYREGAYEDTLRLCERTSPYGLTGSIFARERQAVTLAEEILAQAAGNFYINDKPTGAAVNQQPFGGARASGTNDKAGSKLNMLRWTSPRVIKEAFVPETDYRYLYMQDE